MSGRLVLLLVAGLANGAPHATRFEEIRSVPGTEAWALDLVDSLPWRMEVTEVRETTEALEPDACAEGVERRLSYRLRSKALRLEISISEYPAACAAGDALEATLAAASPDTGLTYAWDLLLLAEQGLARLHAECTWSAASFEVVAGELEHRLEEEGWRMARKVLCRCGGGCREVAPEQRRSGNE